MTEEEVLNLADYLDCNGPELWHELEPVFERIRIQTKVKTIADIWAGVVVRNITDQEVQKFMKDYSHTTRRDNTNFRNKFGQDV